MSVITKYTSGDQALDESKTGQLLDKLMLDVVRQHVAELPKIMKELIPILKTDTLSPTVFNILVRPWLRANMLASWWKTIKWGSEKDRVDEYLSIIDKFELLLNRDPGYINMLMLFMRSVELNSTELLSIFAEIKEFHKIFIQHEFQNGKPCSPSYFIEYGVYSLFYMAEQMGLSRKQQNKYVAVITGELYTNLKKRRCAFDKINFLNRFEKNKNTALYFIYDPTCPVTQKTLSYLKT